MPQELILHIGCEKTGSSSLQTFLTKNELGLRKQGFHYPCGRFHSYFQKTAHAPVAAAHGSAPSEYIEPRRRRRLHRVKSSLQRTLSDIDGKVILSSEHFSSRLIDTAEIRSLAETLGNRQVRVICYIREQASLLLAAYSTAIRTGRTTELKGTDADAEDAYFNHLKMLEKWESVFGGGNLVIVPYTRSNLVGGDVCRDFCSRVGIDFVGLLAVEERYRSLDALQCEAVRILNQVLPSFAASPENWHKSQVLRRSVIRRLPNGPPLSLLLGDDDRRKIQDTFRPYNDQIAERYLPGGLPQDWLNWPPVAASDRHPPAIEVLSNVLADVVRDGRRPERRLAAQARRDLGLGR